MKKAAINDNNLHDFLCVRIFGGLGNQMFQYAAAFAQARRLNVDLALHVISTKRLEHASFGLDIFPLTASLWDPEEGTAVSKQIRLLERLGRKSRKARLGGNWPGPSFAHESLTVSQGLQKVEAGTYLLGYFQSEDYFSDHDDAVREQFCLDHITPQCNADSLAVVDQKNSVSVHIRRGDYLNDPKVLKIHGIMEDDYYEAGRKLMQKMAPDAHFCIFSDDQTEAEKLTKNWSNTTLMPEAPREQDLLLMSRCHHHIVANSSFSWWGAWLNAKQNKQVIAPRRWFTRNHMQTTYIDDICPKGWLLI